MDAENVGAKLMQIMPMFINLTLYADEIGNISTSSQTHLVPVLSAHHIIGPSYHDAGSTLFLGAQITSINKNAPLRLET
jgi:hypothetical protein